MKVFDGVSVDGVSTEYRHFHQENLINIYLSGNLGGGTVSLETLTPDRTEWIPVPGGEFTELGLQVLSAAPTIIRLALSGSTSPNLNAWIESDNMASRAAILKPLV